MYIHIQYLPFKSVRLLSFRLLLPIHFTHKHIKRSGINPIIAIHGLIHHHLFIRFSVHSDGNNLIYGFERLTQRVLRECGFSQVEVTKKSGDGGIDGTGKLKINGIFSFNVAFQCKRYKGVVGAPDIRDFRGSLTTNIEKGLFITTGTFSKAAREEACSPGKQQIDLLDGEEFIKKITE